MVYKILTKIRFRSLYDRNFTSGNFFILQRTDYATQFKKTFASLYHVMRELNTVTQWKYQLIKDAKITDLEFSIHFMENHGQKHNLHSLQHRLHNKLKIKTHFNTRQALNRGQHTSVTFYSVFY